MRYFSLSFLIFMVACASYPKKNNLKETEVGAREILNPYFSNTSKDYVYKANITVQKKEFGGLFIVKKTGPNNHRVVFTTEIGSKILDFSFEGDKFTINYLLDAMNKKMLVNILESDFRALTSENPQVSSTFTNSDQTVFETQLDKKKYYYFYKNDYLEKIIRVSGADKKTEYLFLEAKEDLSNKIEIRHENFPLQITLDAL